MDDDADGQLALAAKNVSSTIDELMALLSGNNIGTEYCTQATHSLNNAATHIAASNNPIKKQRVYEKARNMVELSSSNLKDLEQEFYKHLTANDSMNVARTTSLIAKEVEDVIRAASNGAFLLADLDPRSVPSQKPAFDSGELEELLSKLRPLLDAVTDDKLTVKDAYKHADSLLDYSSVVCNLCEDAVKRITDDAICAQILEISGKVALSATNLCPAIKQMGADKKGKASLLSGCQQLQATLIDLATIANSPVTGGTLTKPSPQAQVLQDQLAKSSDGLLSDARKVLMNVQVNMNAPNKVSKADFEPKFKEMKSQIGNIMSLVQKNSPGDSQGKQTIDSMNDKINGLKKLEKTLETGEIPESADIVDLNAFKELVRSIGDWTSMVVTSEKDGRKLVSLLEELPERFEAVIIINS